jgi:transcriptional regulator GlxA family with amidase domain
MRSILFVAWPGFQMLDLVGPFEIFSGANQLLKSTGRAVADYYRLEVVSHDGRSVRTSNGLSVDAHRSLRFRPKALDTLFVPGGLVIDPALEDRALIRWIRNTAPRARRVASVCSGSFLLAEAGLLDGKRATTHWSACARLQHDYPKLRVEPDPIFVIDGALYTSAGVTSGMDLSLALIEEDLGAETALVLARWFVMFLKRPGGQSQFSMHLRAQLTEPAPLQDLLSFIADHPASDLSVEALAERVHLSPRHFARVFREMVGATPAAYVLDARLEHARRALEDSREGLKTIAARAGFGSEESIRRAFHSRLGVTPGDYRQRFQRAAPSSRRMDS